MTEIASCLSTILDRLRVLMLAMWQLAVLIASWKYFPHVAIAAAAVVGLLLFNRSYRRWRRAWLSYLVQNELNEIRRKARATKRREHSRRSLTAIWRECQNIVFRLVQGTFDYLTERLRNELLTIYLPSLTSVLLVLVVLALFLFIPHPPTHLSDLWHPLSWWKDISADLGDKDGIPRFFEGLIVVIVALIVFVAESVRGSKNSDEKRVLLKISNLWPLAILVTITPLTFLYPPATGLSVVLAIGIMIIAIVAFAGVLRNLLDAGSSIRAQRLFLKDRVRSMVLYSARERVGNKLLFDRLGKGKEVAINFTIARSWLPNGEKNYAFVPAPGHGTLIDINVDRLKALAQYLERREKATVPAPQATAQIGVTAGPSPSGASGTDDKLNRAYLLRRFQEELPQESVFSRNTSVLAVPNVLALDKAAMEDVRNRARHIFTFSTEESPSAAFRREMESTKDRLITAIRGASLGAIEDLKQTYLLIAEEFLTILNELGGGYTAEQAREERSNIFAGWSEVRWMVRDVRELLIAAAQTDNTDVIGNIAFLPYAIAIRALQAGDQLLFQEFLSFGSFIYFLGSEKPVGSPVRAFLTERSWRYLREIAEYYVQPLLTDGDTDD